MNERVDELIDVVLELAHAEKQSVDYSEQHELARQAATESIVLLKIRIRSCPYLVRQK